MTAYDWDAIVIGAGPAGIAAAIRLRWVKGYHAVPASVVLLDPEAPGGLAAMGGCVMTGPSFAGDAETTLRPLLADLEALRVPRIAERATGLRRAGPLLEVVTETGRALRALSVVLATGFRALHGEAAYFGRRLHVTYKGYGFFPSLLRQAALEAAGGGFAIIGHGDTLDLLPLIAPIAAQAGGVELLLQPPVPDRELPPGVSVRIGVTEGYTGADGVDGVHFRSIDGTRTVVPCRAVLVDYHAFERRPEAILADGPLQPRRDERGFVLVDSYMCTSEPGLFAAGDVTGRYASTLMALGDGVCAGFSAYRYTYERKFACEPSLFAYAATGPLPAEAATQPLFDPPDAARLVLLGDEGALAALLEKRCPHPERVLACVREGSAVRTFTAAAGVARAEAVELLFAAMHKRLLTLHHVEPA